MRSWKRIKDYPNYEVSRSGEVRNIKTGRILKHALNIRNYHFVNLCNENGPKSKVIHRLVAIAFIPNPENYPQVNHKDGNKINNHVSNLEWVTNQMNAKHAHETGLNDSIIGENHYKSKLTKNQVIEIRNRAANGESMKSLSKEYPVCYTMIARIVRRQGWKHIKS